MSGLKMQKHRIMWWDLETAPLAAYIWQPGKQYVGHAQLLQQHSRPRIISAAWCFNDGLPAECIDWGYEEQDTSRIVIKLDALIKTADVVIGKNSNSFDNKVLNSARMFANLPGMPDWIKYTDDLERQMRKHFRLPSQSLDYISNQLGLGGKVKMSMSDWIDIVEKNENGANSLRKMCEYNMKDVEDTRTLWNYLSEHFEPRFNVSTFHNSTECCKNCGSGNVHKNGTKVGGGVKYQTYMCRDCNRYAGRKSVVNEEGRLK